MKSILKKGQREVSLGKIMIFILVLLVVFSVLMFWFRADLNKYLRNLIPDFSPDGGEDVVGTQLSAPCGDDFLVGSIDATSGVLSFCYYDVVPFKPDPNCENPQVSGLYWRAEGDKAEISVKSIEYIKSTFVTGPVEHFESIGEYDGKTFSVLDKILSRKGDFYNRIMSKLPNDLILANLNGSYKKNLNICRKEKIDVVSIIKKGDSCGDDEKYLVKGYLKQGKIYFSRGENLKKFFSTPFEINGDEIDYSGIGKVGKIVEGKIVIDSVFLDGDSWVYQSIRFLEDNSYSLSDFANVSDLKILNNVLCRDRDDLTKIWEIIHHSSWPEKEGINVLFVFGTIKNPSSTSSVLFGWVPYLGKKIFKNKLVLNFGRNLIKESTSVSDFRFEFNKKNYIEIFYASFPVGRIYPDGSIWFLNSGSIDSAIGNTVYKFGRDVKFKDRASSLNVPSNLDLQLEAFSNLERASSGTRDTVPKYESNLRISVDDFNKFKEGLK